MFGGWDNMKKQIKEYLDVVSIVNYGVASFTIKIGLSVFIVFL